MAGELTAEVVADPQVLDVEYLEHGRVDAHHDHLLHQGRVAGEHQEGGQVHVLVLGPQDDLQDGGVDLDGHQDQTKHVPVVDPVHQFPGRVVDQDVDQRHRQEVLAVSGRLDQVGHFEAEHGPAVEPVNEQQEHRKLEVFEKLQNGDPDPHDVVAGGPDLELGGVGLGDHADGQEDEQLEGGRRPEEQVAEHGPLLGHHVQEHPEEQPHVDVVLLVLVFETGRW